jgi:hypothetical protein
MKAFPVPRYVNSSGGTFDPPIQGMDLRDYFAAKAMQGLLTHPKLGARDPVEIAGWAYDQADCMMKERDE